MSSNIRRTVAGSNTFDFTNGKRGKGHRGGTIEILDFPDDGRTRIDVYGTTAGVRVNASQHDADEYTRTLARVSQAMWAAEGARPAELEPMTEAEYAEVARTALGVCQFTGRLDCKERDCELHYMAAPLRLRDDYRARELGRVTGAGPDPATGGKYHLKVTGAGEATKWLGVSPEKMAAIVALLSAEDEPEVTS